MKKLLFIMFMAWLSYIAMGCTPNNDNHVWTEKHKHCQIILPNGTARLCCIKDIVYPSPALFYDNSKTFVLLAHGGIIGFDDKNGVEFHWTEVGPHKDFQRDVWYFHMVNGKWIQD